MNNALGRYVRWRQRLNGAAAARERGDAARDARRWAEAAVAYQEFVDREPRAFGIWVQLGHVLRESARYPESAAAYARARTIRDDDDDLHLSLGHLFKATGDYDKARMHYAESYRLGGGDTAAAELAADLTQAQQVPPAGTPAKSRGAASVQGAIDSTRGGWIRGWAIDPANPGTPAVVEFVDPAGLVVGTAVARLDRPDLIAAGMSSAVAGFETVLGLDFASGHTMAIQVRLKRTGEALPNSPVTMSSTTRTATPARPVTDARFDTAKVVTLTAGRETALFVTHAPDGVVKPHVLPYLRALATGGVETLLIVVADRPVAIRDDVAAAVAGVIVRENAGYDFAAWAHALRLFPEAYRSSVLYLINDSMFGPNRPDALHEILDRVRGDDADLLSMTETHEFAWHLQSYFLAIKQRVLGSFAFQFFINDIGMLATKQEVVNAYEMPFASRMVAAGFHARPLFTTDEPRNPTMHGWRELIGTGFPFVKTLLFRERFAEIDMTDWRDLIEEAGFDVALLEATLKHVGVTGPAQPGFPLLAPNSPRRSERARPAGALKVAFYGPWNYDNGLGSASRGMVAALRHADIRLNLHPVKKRFHVHRPLAPPFDVADFEGPADVAIVHLNPDSWSLLTDEQRGEIARARKRIGYWVWEMGHLPPAWREEYSSVDRIWAASAYNADLFVAQDEAPVDVVPHAVPLPVLSGDQGHVRREVCERLGLASDRRLILYVFDGSSYLVRKNPAALVRAFAASGLGRSGWTLVLKTKHLNDRPEEGAAFARLAEATAEVVVIDRSLPQEELDALMRAADIYASPHCSEGFGLTVAEAMAMGKLVVATDFSGTRQFLDASCGYPVAATPYVLDRDFGHYTRGGEWARIDEGALASALTRAAADVARGDTRLGDAARARIGDRLSYAAIGSLVAASLDRLWEDGAHLHRAPPPLEGAPGSGIPVASARFDDAIVVVPLDAAFRPKSKDLLRRIPDSRETWAVFAPEEALLSPLFQNQLLAFAETRPDVAIVYGDDVAMGEDTLSEQVRYKPDFDLTLFAAQDYIGVPLIVRGSALHALGGLRSDAGAAAICDLVLRATAAGMSIARLPEVLLVYPERRPRVPAAARRAVLAAHPGFADYEVLPGLTPETTQLARRFTDHPLVTLLVPTRRGRGEDGTPVVERLLRSLAVTDWPSDRLDVLIGDDIAGDPGWSASRAFGISRLETLRAPGEPFNYAAKMNRLWRASRSEHVIFLNDDVVVTKPGWLKALMTFAMDGAVGGVGPRLLYDDGSIQHAGVAGGLFGVAAHCWLGRRTSQESYQDWILTHRQWSMVTGAVFATRRSAMEQVNGFDEQFALEFNDLDLCLRMRALGLRIVYTPHATMTHSEKVSRGVTPVAGEQTALFLRRWRAWLNDDPAFPQQLRRDRFEIEPATSGSEWFI